MLHCELMFVFFTAISCWGQQVSVLSEAILNIQAPNADLMERLYDEKGLFGKNQSENSNYIL